MLSFDRKMSKEQEIREAIKNIYDPELKRNIVICVGLWYPRPSRGF